ncbi:hypothetical protein [Paraburkholderia strydomiana]|uniref:hypothetical protein n=1 Tax=Paraburkholderia strydomiana TaxID=1245417 RepID=UPI0038B7447A
MHLADFIESDLQGLIDDWADYALALSHCDSRLSEIQLRNSAAEILMSIAADMRESQDAARQAARSRSAFAERSLCQVGAKSRGIGMH